jgi:hypothetical protein
VWIIQEVVAAAHVRVVCGNWIVDWNDLFNAVEIINREIEISGDEILSIDIKWTHFNTLAKQREWEARNIRFTLTHLLEAFRYAEATLQRDRLFALLGFAADGHELDFEPDYEAPFKTIVRKYAHVFIKKGRVMDLLYHAGSRSWLTRFPSWIPDWTTPTNASLYHSSKCGIPCGASKDSEPKVHPNPDLNILDLEALQTNLLGWRFFVTKRGFVGIAPNHAVVGDVISIFSGSGFPFLLRKSMKEDAYRLVGECYMLGIMLGEAFEEEGLKKILLY